VRGVCVVDRYTDMKTEFGSEDNGLLRVRMTCGEGTLEAHAQSRDIEKLPCRSRASRTLDHVAWLASILKNLCTGFN